MGKQMSKMPSHIRGQMNRTDPHGRKRTTGQLYKDRVDIAKLYVQGYTASYITHWISENRDYTLAESTIRNDITAIIKEWREHYLPDIDLMKSAELARIDAVIQEAWKGWFASIKDKETTESEHMQQDAKQRVGNLPAKPIYEETKSKIKTEQRDGDPKFLLIINRCIAMRAKILGIEAPSRHEIKDWRKEAEKAGFNPGEEFERMVNEVVNTADEADDEQTDSDS
jgi:hypothetical protein